MWIKYTAAILHHIQILLNRIISINGTFNNISFSWCNQVIEVTPTHCVVEISRSAGELRAYKEVKLVFSSYIGLLIYVVMIRTCCFIYASSVKAYQVCLKGDLELHQSCNYPP